MDEQILEVLKDIREEAKQTNVRLASVEVRLASVEGEAKQTNVQLASVEEEAKLTNVRLASLEGRVEFLEKRTSRGFETLNERLQAHVERLELLARQQAQSEIRLATEVLSLADVTRDVRDLIARKLDDHEMVLEHDKQIQELRQRVFDGGKN